MYLQGIVLVYDMTSLDTFNQLAKWIGYVQTVCNRLGSLIVRVIMKLPLQHATADVNLMLVASKSDLEAKREVTREDGTKVHKINYGKL